MALPKAPTNPNRGEKASSADLALGTEEADEDESFFHVTHRLQSGRV